MPTVARNVEEAIQQKLRELGARRRQDKREDKKAGMTSPEARGRRNRLINEFYSKFFDRALEMLPHVRDDYGDPIPPKYWDWVVRQPEMIGLVLRNTPFLDETAQILWGMNIDISDIPGEYRLPIMPRTSLAPVQDPDSTTYKYEIGGV